MADAMGVLSFRLFRKNAVSNKTTYRIYIFKIEYLNRLRKR